MQMILSLVQTPLQVYFTPTAAPDSLPLAKCEILKDGSVLEIQGLGQRRKKQETMKRCPCFKIFLVGDALDVNTEQHQH